VAVAIVAICYLVIVVYAVDWVTTMSVEDMDRWKAVGSLVTVFGFFPALLLLGIAVFNWTLSQRKPDLKLVFTDSLTESTKILRNTEYGTSYPFHFAVVNEGNRMALWFEVIVDFSNIREAVGYATGQLVEGWYRLPEQQISKFRVVFRSAGGMTVFKESPLDLGTLNVFVRAESLGLGELKIPYQINGAWGEPKKGMLCLNVGEPPVSASSCSGAVEQTLKKEAVITMEGEAGGQRSVEVPPHDSRLLSQTRPFTVGILFFFFSLTLFALPSPSCLVEATAVVVFALSMLFLATILMNLVPRDIVRAVSKKLSEWLGRQELWILTVAAYLTAYGLSFAKGTAGMERDTLEHLIEVVGCIWFFVIFAVLLSTRMISLHKTAVYWLLVSAVSLVFITIGAVVACRAPGYEGRLSGALIIVSGVVVVIAAKARDKLAPHAPL